MRRLIRAAKRTVRRLVRPLRLAHIDYMRRHSASELARITEMRHDLHQLECNEHHYQVHLELRRQQIESGRA